METESSQIDPAFPNHELIRMLRAGRTYLFRQSASGEQWVLKRIRNPGKTRATARRLSRLNVVEHPLSAPRYRSVEIGQTTYTLRRYVEGTPAGQALLQSKPPAAAPVVVEFALQVALELRALHRVGLVHGNLHPNNLIVDSDGGVQLIDLADPPPSPLPDDATAPAPDRGIYLSPEQLRGYAASPRSDLFSLGVILYQLLTGQHPFAGSHLIEIAHRTLYEVPLPLFRFRPELSEPLGVLVERLLAKRPYQRFASTQQMARALLPLMRETATATRQLSQESASLAVSNRGHWSWRRVGTLASQTANSGIRLLDPVLGRWRRLTTSRQAVGLLLAALLVPLALVLLDRHRSRVLSQEIAADISAGKTTRARQRLQAEIKKHGADPLLHKLWGDVSCSRKEYADCLKHYREATTASRRYSSDEVIQKNVLSMLDAAGNSTDLVQVIARLDGAIEPELIEGTQSEHYWKRWNSVRALEARGASKRIDYAVTYSMDLIHGSRCETRRAAASKLAQLRDRKALPYLKRAQATTESSFFDRLCMGDSIRRAIRTIEESG